MNTTQVGFESLFPRQLSTTNRAFVVRSILHRVSSHNYLYHRQNIDLRYPSSKSREPVEEVRIKLCASLDTAMSALDSIHQNHLGREGLRWSDGQLMT